MAIVYLLTNRTNMKRYVGKTTRSLKIRWDGHVAGARRTDNDMLVCRAMRKHGSDAFTMETLEECDEQVLGQREVHWIRVLGTHVSQGGYNLTFGGDGGLPGYKFSEASKEKIRQKALGRKHTEETRTKMREAKLGKKQSPEVIEARRQKLLGQKRTEETCRRISEGLQGREVSKATRAKLSATAQMRVTSEETKQKLRESCTGWSHTDDVKHRIAAARSRAVMQFDEQGTLIGEYPSIKEAVRLSGKASSSILRSLASGRYTAGCLWQYRD